MPPLAPESGTTSAPEARTSSHSAATLLHAVFDRSAAAHPGVVAIDVPPAPGRARETLTYAEASERSHAIAAQLSALVHGECVVAIALPRTSADLYVAMLGVMRVGAAYTCFEPSLAADRARHLLEDSGAVAVLVREEDRARFLELGVPAERLVVPAERGTAPQANGRPHVVTPDMLAYVIYTSGTTGRPKGVLIEHRNVVNLVESDRGYFGLGPGDRCAQSSMCSYDSSVEEIWLAWGAGATLVLMDDDAVRLGPDLVPWLQRERITVFCPPPTLLRMATCSDPRHELPDLKLIYVGGEELPLDVAARWAPGRRLENGYGPTECAVTCVRTPVEAGEPVRIGWPVAGNTAFVLDGEGREVLEGVVGELWMGGAGVARGYLNQPELTAERFVTHPDFGRLYRTGDLARRERDGALVYLGRSDSQVKIRGHRVELSAIEASLCACDGVVAAACALQGEAPLQELSAFLVTDGARPARVEAVRDHMLAAVPDHMQPAHYAIVESLPTRDASGKLDRSALPDIRPAARSARARVAAFDGTEQEHVVAAAFAAFVPSGGLVGPDDDFFLDLGGNSLVAAQVISCLRTDAMTASLTMRDLYEARTARALAARIETPAEPKRFDAPAPREALRGAASPGALAQLAFVAGSLVPGAAITWVVVFLALPVLERALGTAGLLLSLPLVAFAAELAWLPIGLALTMAAKAALVGRYREGRHDYLGSFHVRHWIVVHLAHTIPWALVQGSELGNACLRALGARIGRDVHLHRGVDLADGGWDLLHVGDGATLGRDASVGIVEWHDRQLVFARVDIGAGATLDTRAHVAGGARVGANGFLGALSSLADGATLPAGECWRGVPATRVDEAVPDAPVSAEGVRPWNSATHAIALLAARAFSSWLPLVPGLLLALACLRPGAPGTGMLPAPFGSLPLAWAPFVLMAGYAASLPMEALVARLFGRVREGAHPLRSATGIAIAMKEHAVETANAAISGTLLWPMWLRMSGARIGRKCEISTVMEVVPELTEVGDECFFADGIYLGRPLLHRGHAVCARTTLSKNTFFGNHAVIPAGASLPPGILLGICTVADPARVTEGTSWFGNPPLELPRREIAESERELTHDPGFARFFTRVVFESVRLVLPLGPLALAWGWFTLAPRWQAAMSAPAFFLLALPASFVVIGAVLLAAAIFVKWCVMGPIREGRHMLWSCWCCRWDVLFEVWAAYAVPVLLAFEGTPFVSWWLRAMGCRIGHGVVFGSSFLQVVDPDMLEIGDGATVSCHLQSHSFEDRVLKLARVRIAAGSDVARGAVLLYGADIGERAEVTANSVVMKQELLLPGRRYEGCPTRAVR
ncbi:MAG: amino acid adenylation domain-containing protein [Candidatus Eisenbacteria bacterium]|nr:amino acid adenylation domain-containing protein [Candidatus Eisenbacteria bacterium]